MHKFLGLGEQNGTTLVRRRRRQTSFQFTVMRPRGGARGSAMTKTQANDTYRSVTDMGNTAFGRRQAAQLPQQQQTAGGPGPRAGQQQQQQPPLLPPPPGHPAPPPPAPANTKLRIGTAELAVVRAVGR